MNQERFDGMARGLATNRLSRWQVLKALAAGTFLGLTGSTSRRAYGAPPPGKGPCREPRVKCHGVCCLTGEECVNGRCLPLGTHDNCAGVGDMCAANETCCCDPELPPGLLCNCINLSSDDINHCGACDNPCSGVYDACCGGVCRDLNSDEVNCGDCFHDCPGTTICQEGDCLCPSGLTDCGGGRCLNLQTDNANCGACGRACGSCEHCDNGVCQLPSNSANCPPGQDFDPQTCMCKCPLGQTVCGTVCCDTTSVCSGGHCCGPDEVWCAGYEGCCTVYPENPNLGCLPLGPGGTNVCCWNNSAGSRECHQGPGS
jgi:hypothetical protein